MHVLLVFLTLIAAVEQCWAREKIVGGRRSKENEFPYQLSLRWNGKHLCGAALISKNTALTAAHCFKSKGSYSIRGGSININNGEEVPVIMALTHPYHNSLNEDYDIAVMKLASSLKLSKSLQPVKLPYIGQQIKEGDLGTVTGWGSISDLFPEAVEYLRAVELPILPKPYCQSRYYPVKLSRRMFCAGYREGGRDSCQGDSGGPFVMNGTIFGIVSWGFNCAEPGYPGIYTNVAMVRDFIKANTGL